MIICSGHTRKSAELVQTLPIKVWLENVKGAVSSHCFYASSFHLFCSWDKRIKLADSIMRSVSLKIAAEQLCLFLIKFVLMTIQWCTALLVEGHRTTVCYGLEKPLFSKMSTSTLPLLRVRLRVHLQWWYNLNN